MSASEKQDSIPSTPNISWVKSSPTLVFESPDPTIRQSALVELPAAALRPRSAEYGGRKDIHSLHSSIGIRTANHTSKNVHDCEWIDPESVQVSRSNSFCQSKNESELRHSEANVSPAMSRFGMLGPLANMYGAAPHDAKLMAFSEDESEDNFDSYPAGWRRAALLVCALVPFMIASLDDTIIATLVPVLINRFDRPEDIGWYASAEYLPYAVLMPSLGKAYKLWKVKWLFLGSVLIFMIGSITCATAPTSRLFILGRGITGTGGAGILQGSMRINEITFPRRQRMYVEAVGIAIMGACIMAGPLVGGAIADNLGWEWAFWVNVPSAAVSFIGALFLFPKEVPRSPLTSLPTVEKIMRLDPVGASFLITSIFCLICVLQDYAGSLTLGLNRQDTTFSVMTGTLFVLFILQEIYIRPDLALIPRSILRRRSVWSNCLVLFFLFMGFTNFVFFLSIFLQVVQGYSPGQSALNLLPYVISATVASGVISFCVPKARYYNPFFLAGGVLFTVGMGLIIKINEDISTYHLAGLQIIVGVGVGILVLANVAPCHTDLPEHDHAVANGLAFFSSSLGSTITVPASSALFNHHIIQDFETLDIPLYLKVESLQDITGMRWILPPQYLGPALAVVVRAINLTFVIGLACSIVAALLVLCIPWKPVSKGREETKETKETQELSVHASRARLGWGRYFQTFV